jgi:hypothetical protein
VVAEAVDSKEPRQGSRPVVAEAVDSKEPRPACRLVEAAAAAAVVDRECPEAPREA